MIETILISGALVFAAVLAIIGVALMCIADQEEEDWMPPPPAFDENENDEEYW